MPAQLSVYLPEDAALVRILSEDRAYELGRAPDCDIVIQHASVSRRHARLAHFGGDWSISDLGSKNGIRLDGVPLAQGRLHDGQWFSVGDVFCQFDRIESDRVEALALRAEQRRHSSQAWTERIHRVASADTLLSALVSAIVELAECRRGLLLTRAKDGDLRVRACFQIDPGELESGRFRYSRGAVTRALGERRPVFLSQPADQAWLGERQSVLAENLKVLACLPLVHEGTLLGVAYADSDEAGKVLNELDAEILTAFSDQAALALAANDLQRELSRLETWVKVAPGSHQAGAGPAPAFPDASTAFSS
jgi:hypothetical protein